MSESISVYMVVNLTINDRDEYRIYEKGFFPFLKKYNGTFITFDDVLQPSPSPRFSKTKLNIKHNANEKGFDNNSIVEEFDLDPGAFN